MAEINSPEHYDMERANVVETYVIYDNMGAEWVPAISIEVGHDEDLSYKEFVDLKIALEHTVELFDKMLDQYGA